MSLVRVSDKDYITLAYCHACVNTRVDICAYTKTQMYIHTHPHTHRRAHTDTYTCTRTHTSAHTHTQTRTHAHTQKYVHRHIVQVSDILITVEYIMLNIFNTSITYTGISFFSKKIVARFIYITTHM